MTLRAPLGDQAYWAQWVSYGDEYIEKSRATAQLPAADPTYEPQFLFVLAQKHWHQMLRRYSAGLPVSELAGYFPGLLDAWERSNAVGQAQWSDDERVNRSAWRVNFDHYIVCFWLIGLALALEIADDQWQRLMVLVGNEGEDILLDRIIATRSTARRIGTALLYPKPYGRLLAAVDASPDAQAAGLRDFVQHWYAEIGSGARSSSHQQAVAFKHPYWYRYGDENFAGGAYFGRWCVEAVAAVKAFALDDGLCRGFEHYPTALLHPDVLGGALQGEREVAVRDRRQGFWGRLFNR